MVSKELRNVLLNNSERMKVPAAQTRRTCSGLCGRSWAQHRPGVCPSWAGGIPAAWWSLSSWQARAVRCALPAPLRGVQAPCFSCGHYFSGFHRRFHVQAPVFIGCMVFPAHFPPQSSFSPSRVYLTRCFSTCSGGPWGQRQLRDRGRTLCLFPHPPCGDTGASTVTASLPLPACGLCVWVPVYSERPGPRSVVAVSQREARTPEPLGAAGRRGGPQATQEMFPTSFRSFAAAAPCLLVAEGRGVIRDAASAHACVSAAVFPSRLSTPGLKSGVATTAAKSLTVLSGWRRR